MFNRELPKLWSDAIVAGDATILSIPVNLLHLLTFKSLESPTPEDPADLHSYIAWFKLREPLHLDSIEECVAALNQERDSLSTLEGMSEARIARHGLPAGLMARMKASVKT